MVKKRNDDWDKIPDWDSKPRPLTKTENTLVNIIITITTLIITLFILLLLTQIPNAISKAKIIKEKTAQYNGTGLDRGNIISIFGKEQNRMYITNDKIVYDGIACAWDNKEIKCFNHSMNRGEKGNFEYSGLKVVRYE